MIDIVTPNNRHTGIAIAAAKAGKHMFCEKLLAITRDEAKEMLKAVEENGAMHVINHNDRFSPAIQ